MKLSLRFIAKKLSLVWKDTVVALDDEDLSFTTARYSDGTRFIAPRQDWVLIFEQSAYDEALVSKSSGIIWIGAEEPPEGKPAIWIKDQAEPMHVLNYVLDMFDLMAHWSSEVQRKLLRKEPIENVVRTLSEVTNNPYYYCDSGFKTLAIRDDAPLVISSDIYRYQIEHGRHPVEAIASMMRSGDLDRINKNKHAWLFEDSTTYRIPFVSKTIFCHGGVYGHLFIIETNSDQVACDIETLEELGNLISLFVDHHFRFYPSSGRQYEQALKALLSGKDPGAEEIDTALAVLSWNKQDRYRILVFEPCGEEGTTRDTIIMQQQVIENNLDAKGVIFGASVVAFVNEGNEGPSDYLAAQQRRDQVQTLCRQFQWRIGASDSFCGIENTRPYYEQAFAALQIGLKTDPETEIHDYYAYLLPHMRAVLKSEMDSPLLRHCDVTRLLEYDRETHSSLTETLRVFLRNERNISRTSSDLYMHRNSVMYRIDKIKQLIVSDLDDPDNRLALMISLDAAKADGSIENTEAHAEETRQSAE